MYVSGVGVSTIICILYTFPFLKSVTGPANDIASWRGFRHRSTIYIYNMYSKKRYIYVYTAEVNVYVNVYT